MSEEVVQANLLPTLPEFPVRWETPTDELLLWMQERVHFPMPSTPLEFLLVAQPIYIGLNRASKRYGVPLQGDIRHINTYVYEGYLPPEEESEGPDSEETSLQKLSAAMAEMGVRWRQEWLPEIQGHLSFWESFDLRGASMAALLVHLDKTQQRLYRMWEIHNLLWYPMYLAMSLYDEMYLELFEGATLAEAYQRLVGVETRTTAGNQALWALSRQALALPAVCRVLVEHAAGNVLALLGELADGQPFLAGLNEFLQEYGRRSEGFRLRDVSWLEDPTPAIKIIQGYMAHPDRDLAAETQKIAVRRAEQVIELRQRLQNYPQGVVEQFEKLFAAAQEGYFLSEEHTYWIDFQTVYQTRQIVLECGRRLAAAGILETSEDVFFLTLEELQGSAGADSGRYRQHVQERRGLDSHFGAITPPPMLGTLPTEPPPDDPILRSFGKFLGDPLPPSERADELRGHAGSPGLVQGKAKVILTLAEADRLVPGDILVTETTILPWTPLFASISGLVTNAGGILCHSAIVAREYGIPAVVGTGMATQAIQDGQLIEVDGTRGLVRILSQ